MPSECLICSNVDLIVDSIVDDEYVITDDRPVVLAASDNIGREYLLHLRQRGDAHYHSTSVFFQHNTTGYQNHCSTRSALFL